MLGLLEDKRNEFKIKLTDTFEKEVVAFLNTEGGNIFIGVDDKGNINGITQQKRVNLKKISSQSKFDIILP